ncbi:hypothetical protein CJU64_11565 [Escherichia coli]|nr:hypothetical protein CJU64_11565 [Escherichia coli]
MLLCQQGQGKVLYRYALAIARAAEGDKMPIKKPEFDEGRTQASVKFWVFPCCGGWYIIE